MIAPVEGSGDCPAWMTRVARASVGDANSVLLKILIRNGLLPQNSDDACAGSTDHGLHASPRSRADGRSSPAAQPWTARENGRSFSDPPGFHEQEGIGSPERMHGGGIIFHYRRRDRIVFGEAAEHAILWIDVHLHTRIADFRIQILAEIERIPSQVSWNLEIGNPARFQNTCKRGNDAINHRRRIVLQNDDRVNDVRSRQPIEILNGGLLSPVNTSDGCLFGK